MPFPNWFLAFPIDGAFLLELPAVPKAFRRFHPEDVHLTLAFLGGCGEKNALAAVAALDAHLRHAPVSVTDVSLGQVVPMGSRRRYTALSALVEEGREEISATIAALRDVLTDAAGARRDERPPKPHVTLARPRRRATDADREAGIRWAAELDLRSVRARLDRVALYTRSDQLAERNFEIVEERLLV